MIDNTARGSASDQKPKLFFFISKIASVELIIAAITILTISPSSQNAWLLGFSAQRWLLMLFTFFLAACVLVIGRALYHRKLTLKSALHIATNSFIHRLLLLLAFLLILWAICAIFCPAYYFGSWAPYFDRLRPLSITIGLILLQFGLVTFFADNKIDFHLLYKSPFLRTTCLFTICILALTAFIAITKIGIVKDTDYWNVPGIPLTGQQFLIIVISICLGMYLFPKVDQITSAKGLTKLTLIIPFLIYLAAALTWGLTPMLKHFFSFQPTPPNYQPFPYSDARVDDLGGISIIKGYGINFHNSTDKPLYMVFLAILHLISGYNYSLITWLQIFVLAFIPVVLYLFGKKFHGIGFGLFLSIITIFRQRNAIVLSWKIASVNPKLLITEVITFLAIVLIAYLVFTWIKTRNIWLAVLTGGLIGAASLIRMNPFFLFPAIALLILVAFWRSAESKWRHLAFYTLGFLIIVLPWIVAGVNQNGIPWALSKIIAVADSRYVNVVQPTPTSVTSSLLQGTPAATGMLTPIPQPTSAPEMVQQATPISSAPTSNTLIKASSFSDLFFSHFLHNFTTSALALPDALTYDELSDSNELNALSLRPYWIDGNKWQGDLPPSQVIFLSINLALIAIGLGYSWNRYRWAGLIPLIIFLGYDISLGFAMNSGSRYIVPIDWILYFYYGLAFVCIIRWITDTIAERKPNIQVSNDNVVPFSNAINKKRLWQSLAIVIIVASLVPIADDIMPLFFSHSTQSTDENSLIASIPTSLRNGTQIISGDILYPDYSIDGFELDFDFLADQQVNSYVINLQNQPLKTTLQGDEKALIGFSSLNNNKVEFIYLQSGSSLDLIWRNDSSN